MYTLRYPPRDVAKHWNHFSALYLKNGWAQNLELGFVGRPSGYQIAAEPCSFERFNIVKEAAFGYKLPNDQCRLTETPDGWRCSLSTATASLPSAQCTRWRLLVTSSPNTFSLLVPADHAIRKSRLRQIELPFARSRIMAGRVG
jgi:hypothetical protein